MASQGAGLVTRFTAIVTVDTGKNTPTANAVKSFLRFYLEASPIFEKQHYAELGVKPRRVSVRSVKEMK